MLHQEAHWRLSYIWLDSAAMMHKVLSLTLHRFKEGTAIFLSRIPSFDSHYLIGLAIPI